MRKLILLTGMAAAVAAVAYAQAPAPRLPEPARPYKIEPGPQTLNPGAWPKHFPFPDVYDAPAAAPEHHKIRYMDAHIRFVEVAGAIPGVLLKMHGHPYPSVYARDAIRALGGWDVSLDPNAGQLLSTAGEPDKTFPWCEAATPQGPHAGYAILPGHFYRLEFLRLDGADIQKNWKEWYPQAADALLPIKDIKSSAGAAKLSAAWPFPAAYDSYKAAPNSNKVLYEDQKIRLVEVLIRPGETETMHGHPYPSVLAFDSDSGGPPPTVKFLDAKSPLNGQSQINSAPAPEFPTVRCAVTGPRAPYATHNAGTTPIHFYRIEYKRIDGADIRTKWREWYPWMAALADGYAKTPWRLNY